MKVQKRAGSCLICRAATACVGVLCEQCCEELAGRVVVTPEQIVPNVTRASRSALVDVWGRAHLLGQQTHIGRDVAEGVSIIEGHVSRRHAVIERVATRWWVTDAGSANGTLVDGEPITDRVELEHGARLTFGYVSVFFVEDAGNVRVHEPSSRRNTALIASRSVTARDVPQVHELELPRMTLRYHEPTGGGGGIVELHGKTVQLTSPQFELIVILARRMATDRARDAGERGFVAATELMHVVSLETTGPNEDNIRQLVRRVRRVVESAGLPDLIESRRGKGYRLRVGYSTRSRGRS